MNLFENLQNFNESINNTFEQDVDYNILKDNNVDFFENGAGVYRLTTPNGETVDVNIELSNSATDIPKYFVSIPGDDIKTVSVDLTAALLDAANKLDDGGSPFDKIKRAPKKVTESSDGDVEAGWLDLSKNLKDINNGKYKPSHLLHLLDSETLKLDITKLIEYDEDEHDCELFNGKYFADWDDYIESIENIKTESNCSECECEDKELEESSKLEEAGTNKSGYTLNFGAWRHGNGLSFASKNELVSWLRSNYIDLETKIIYNEDVTDNFKNSMHKISHTDINNKDASKKLFDRGYVAIKDTEEDNIEESVKLEKLSIGNKLQTVIDAFDSAIKLVSFMVQFIDEDTIEKMYNKIAGVEEATSGIGGAYTTKAIDLKPTSAISNVKKIDEKIIKVWDEHFDSEEIKKKVDEIKEHPEDVEMGQYFVVKHEDKTYYVIDDDYKYVTLDGVDTAISVASDDEYNIYALYFKYKYVDYSDGDAENGMTAPDIEVESSPYKIEKIDKA